MKSGYFIRLQKLKDTYFPKQTMSQMITDVFSATTEDPYDWSDDRLLEEIEKVGWKKTHKYLYQKSEDIEPLYDVNLLAKYILNTCIEDNYPITNTQLQYLLFRIQTSAILKGKLAFRENFEVWAFNIVVPYVWYEYVVFAKNKITIHQKANLPFKEGSEFHFLVDKLIRLCRSHEPEEDVVWKHFKSLNEDNKTASSIVITPKMIKEYLYRKRR